MAGGSDNLIPPKPGEVRNPKGKPKGCLNRQTIVKKFLEMQALTSHNERLNAALGICNAADAPKTIADQLVASMILNALAGDVKAFNTIMDSGLGKVAEKVENTHTINQMGKIIAEPVGAKADGTHSEGFALTFDIGSDPDNTFNTEEEEENE